MTLPTLTEDMCREFMLTPSHTQCMQHSWCTVVLYVCTYVCACLLDVCTGHSLCRSVITCCVHLPAQFESEFRRFSVDRTKMTRFEAFSALVRDFFRLPPEMHITITYTDPRNSDLLPINNDDNLQRALSTAMPLLKMFVYREQGVWHWLDMAGRLVVPYCPLRPAYCILYCTVCEHSIYVCT